MNEIGNRTEINENFPDRSNQEISSDSENVLRKLFDDDYEKIGVFEESKESMYKDNAEKLQFDSLFDDDFSEISDDEVDETKESDMNVSSYELSSVETDEGTWSENDYTDNDGPQLGDLHEPYKTYMENGEYDSVEEMCNDLGLNYYDVYYTEDEFEDDDLDDDENSNEQKQDDVKENSGLIKNKEDGLAREKEVREDLEKKYPPEQGYQIVSEAYLRDENGNIVKDPETGTARRIDFVVVKDGKVVDSIEVTSTTADKTEQTAKENRIRENGGNYIRDNDGNLVKIPDDVSTRIERRE